VVVDDEAVDDQAPVAGRAKDIPEASLDMGAGEEDMGRVSAPSDEPVVFRVAARAALDRE
jgi:hypothetical protein